MVSKLEQKYGQQIKTVLDNNNPYTQVQDLTPKKVTQPNVNTYNGLSQELKPLPKADFKPLNKLVTEDLPTNLKYLSDVGIQAIKQTGRNVASIPSAITYANKKVQDSSGFTQENKSFYEQQTENDLDRYKSVQQSMESMYDYDYMPENTKNAYQETVNAVISRESYGKTFEEQRQYILSMYQDKPLPDFVQKRIENINSKETEYNLKLENARQNLLELAQKNAGEIQGIEEKYKDDNILPGTRFSGEILGSIIQMTPYIAASAAGGLGGALLSGVAGTGTMYATVYTSSMSKALSEGATREQATDYAHMSALIEAGTEMLSGGIPGAPKGLLSTGIQGKIDDVVKVAVKDGTFRKFISTGVDVFGEGFEEMAAEYLGSMALSIYTEDERTMGELNADAVKAFIMGSVTSATLQIGKVGVIKAAEKFVAEDSINVESIPLEQANTIMNQIALRTGVTSFDGLSYRLEDMPKGQNGYIVNGKEIVLNKAQVEESGLIESALPHEMTHALERVKGYQYLANFVMNLKAQSVGMDLAQLQEVYQEKYNEIHEQELANGNTSHQLEIATQDKMARELVAEFIKNNIASRPYKNANGEIQFDSNGNIITYRDYNALLKLASNQPNSIDKIKKVIRSFIRKGQIAEAQEFDETDKANFLIMQEYLESMDSYLSKVLENADKGLFVTETQEGVQFDTKVLSPMTEQGVNVIRAYESENGLYNGTQEDAEKLLAYSARKGLGFNEVQYDGGTLVRDSNIQLSIDQLQKNDIDVNEVRDITKQLNISTLIPLIQQSKQSASDYINSLNIQSDNPNVIKYLETMSNFIRDYNPELRTDSLGNLTTQQQEDEFTLRENGKLKVYYYEENAINDNALSYGHFLTDNPLDLVNPKQVYVKGNLAQANGTEFSSLNELYEDMTNADVLKQYGSESLLNEIQEKLGFNGLDFNGNVLVFSEEQFKDNKIKTELSENALKDIETMTFKKSGNNYLVRTTNFNGQEQTLVYDYEGIIQTLGSDMAKVILGNATTQEQSYDVVENILAKPSNKVKQGVFSENRDDHNNQLTETQDTYFRGSKIRRKDGTLKVMYHGSQSKFDQFIYDGLGKNGLVDGIGIYFTDSVLEAHRYTRNNNGQIYEVYLDIKNPTDRFTKTITKEQLKNILTDIHNFDDNEFLYNYGDISRVGFEKVLEKAIRNITLDFNLGDTTVIDKILFDSKIETEQGLRIINQYTGIDGYKVLDTKGTVSIAFFPEQIKSINNPNPTNDRRIQYSIELDSVKQQQIEQAKLNSTTNVNEARAILNDGTLTTSDSVPLESVLLNPLYNQAIVYKSPTKAQKERLQVFYLDTLARSGDTIYLELRDGDKVVYLKYPVVSDLSRIDRDISDFYNSKTLKEKQLDIILKENPMIDDYHVGIRSIEDIKSFEEAIQDDESFTWGDFEQEDALSALEKGEITVYSSYPIKQGVFVSTSYIQAQEYAGGVGSRVYKKTIPLDEVAWINGDEGQYAKVENKQIQFSIDDERIATRSFQESVLKTELSKKTSQAIEKDIANGTFNYVVVGDADSIRRGLETIGNDVEQAYIDIKAKFDSRLRMTKDDLVVAQLVLKKLEKTRQTEKVVDLIQNIAILGTELGQQVQALSLIKRMTPEGKLITLQKTLTKLQDSVNSTKDRNAPRVQLEIPKEYQEFFVEASARTQELEEQRVELGSKIEELTQIENEIDSLLLSNVGSEIDNLSRDLSELRALEKEEQRLLSLVENLQNKASTLSSEDIDILQEDINILKEQILTKQGSLNEIKQKQAKLSRLESQLAKVKSGESLFLDYSIEDNQAQIKEYQNRINEINKQKRKFDNLESTLVKLSGIDPNVIAELNAKVKVVRKAERLLKKLIKENERFTSTENVDSVLDEVKTKIAEQLPVTWKDKLDAWRYMAMLGNLRTNVRNVLGNAFVMPMTFSRDVVSVALQQFLPVEQRTRVLRASKEAEAFAMNDFLTVGQERMSGTQKYDMKTDIERKRQIFKNNLLEGYREGTFKALEVGDDVFTRKHYITQMAKYLTAQKIDLNTITEQQLEMARDFAIKEAEKNTFKQTSDLANALNRIERKGGVAGTIVKAVIPFKKTPINILKMGLEYSPLGLLNGIKKTVFDVRSGKVTAAQAIDTLSAGLTGTGIALLGATMYGMGFIEIGGDDDETKRVYNYQNSLGRQRYSVRIGEGSYSIDWIAPAIMPFIMGAEMMRAFESDTEASLIDALYDAGLDIFDPVFELTMLQGVTDTLQSYSGSGAAMFGETLTTMGSNYINQFIPTLLGQISRTVDPIQRSTLPDAKGSLSSTLETIVRKIANKTPLSFMNAPVIDVKGNPISSDENPFMRAFMNLVSPGYYKTDKTNDIDREILRLYELTENTNVIPKATPKSFMLEGETYKLGNKDYSDWGITMGKESYELLGDLSRYDLDDESKVKIMDNIYDYAYQLAKDEYLQKQGKSNEDASYKKIVEAQLKGISITDYLIAKYKFSTMSGEGKKESFNQYLNNNGLSSDLMELVGGYKSSWTTELKTKGLKKLK